jgi:transposase
MPRRRQKSPQRTRPAGLPLPPREHPHAWGSALWDHLEEIRSLRKRRATWKAVAEALAEKGVRRHPAVVRRFFKRALTTRLPDGFEVNQPPPKETTTTTHAPPPVEQPAPESGAPASTGAAYYYSCRWCKASRVL